MKYLLMCEGKNEEALVNLLIDNNKLILTREDLIGRKPYNIRQLTHPVIKTEIKHYNDEIIVYRTQDKQSDEVKVPSDLKDYVSKSRIFKFCTKPELEILLIINEGMLKDYNKSGLTPKQYALKNIKFNGRKYDQSTDFLINYYEKKVNNLVNNISEYKRIKKKHNKEEHYLCELLK